MVVPNRYSAGADLAIGTLKLRLIRDASGRNNWTLGKAQPGRPAFGFLEGTDRLSIADGHVDLQDLQHRFAFAGVFKHDPTETAVLSVVGSGILKGGAIRLQARGGPLNGKSVGQPYPFAARIIDGETEVDARGTSGQPFELSRYALAMRVHGPNLADLTYLFNLQTPNSASYTLTLDAKTNGPFGQVSNLKGRVGKSDFKGTIQSDQSHPRQSVHADLAFGIWTKEDIEAASAETPPHLQARSVSSAFANAKTSRWLRSDEHFPIRRLSLVDIDATLRIANLTGFTAPLSRARVRVKLDQGVLTFSRFTAEMFGGVLTGTARLDASASNPEVKIKGMLRQGNLALVHPREGPAMSGKFDLQLDLKGTGPSLHAAASNAAGRLAIHVDQGRTSRAVDFMVGGDMLRAAGSFGDTHRAIQFDCARATFAARAGVLSSHDIALQTPSGVTSGTGTINLASEQIDLILTGHPIKKRLFQVALPVRIKGSLMRPSASLLPAPAAAALGLKGNVGVFFSPLAAMLFHERAIEPANLCLAQ